MTKEERIAMYKATIIYYDLLIISDEEELMSRDLVENPIGFCTLFPKLNNECVLLPFEIMDLQRFSDFDNESPYWFERGKKGVIKRRNMLVKFLAKNYP